MLGWLRSFRERRRLQGRGLFAFYDLDQSRWRYVDPLQAYRAIFSHDDFDSDRHLSGFAEGFEPEFSEFLAFISQAFGIRPFDGRHGWTNRETLELFNDFMAFVEEQKKNTNGSPTPSSPTREPDSSDLPTGTPGFAGSTFCDPEPNPAEPTGF